MIQCRIYSLITQPLSEYPAVALLGPRQVGKTTLALALAETCPSLYLDLESAADRAKLADPELYLGDHEEKLVILDEVHRLTNLFQPLRGLIDRGRRRGKRTGRFLLLGSASMDPLQQSGETLAGRIAYKVERGFHNACADLRPERRFVVYAGAERFPLGEG